MATENGAGLRLLLAQFGVAVRTPADVAKLKQLILQLAVRGRLVAQNADDESVENALEQAEVDRLEAIANRLSRDRDPILPIAGIQPPFEIPHNWVLCRLGQAVELINGRAYSRSELLNQGTPIIRIQNLNGGDSWYYSDLSLPEDKYCDRGDLLFAWSASFGPYIWNGGRAIYHYHIWKVMLTPVIDKRYCYYLLQYLTEEAKGASHGLAMLHITKTKMENLVIVLPPLAEQHRIVARVDELMAAADELAGQLAAAAGERRRFHTAALARLTAAPSAAGIAPAPPLPGSPAPLSPRPPAPSPWTLLEPHFHRLYADPAAVAELKAAVLQLAVMGRLVENSEVESIKTTVDELCEVRGGIQKSPGRRPSNHPTRYLTVAHVGWGSIDTGDPRYFEVSDEELERWRLLPGDVLVVEGNGSMSQIGRTAVFRGEIENCVHQNHVIRVRPDKRRLLPEYLNLCFMSPQGRQHMIQRSQTSSGLYTLSTGRLKTVELTVPPLAEQHRIVARVDELFALADEAAGRGAAAEGARGRWAEQIMNQEKP